MRLAPLLPLALVAGCIPEESTVPTPPPTAPIAARFATPATGLLDPESAEALVTGLLDDLVVLAAAIALVAEIADAREFISTTGNTTDSNAEGLTAAAPAGPALGVRRDALTADAGAWAELTYLCPGADSSVVVPSTGKLLLRTVLADIDERIVLWGEALRCQVESVEGLATLDADVAGVYELDEAILYVQLVGALRDPGGDRGFDLDFADADGAISLHRVVEGYGTFFVGVDLLEDGRGAVTVRDAEGEWLCTYQEAPPRGVCRRGEEVLQWP
ncbi:MAG: hypothetical protein H6705_20515 [Myxococcales bacterium]|nr:hypothetical protein [Myxococcales bacterium]